MKMRSVAAVLSSIATAAIVAACGSSVESTPEPAGDCKTSTDCGGSTCAEVTAGGYRICLDAPPEATACNTGSPTPDGCCSSADCQGGGKCYDQSKLPVCGGPFPAPSNACIGDACQADIECTVSAGVQRICAPAGAFGNPVRACVNAYCKTDADCTAAEGGKCAPIAGGCCSTSQGLACVYPGGCMKDADCGTEEHCEITDGKGQCVVGITGCPV